MFTRVIDASKVIAQTQAERPQATAADAPGLRVIEPKLMVPRIQPGVLRRAGLLDMVDSNRGAALVLISAPAGYGKTTLLRAWCIERHEPVIWMTLDAADDDPVRLWAHLATAVERLSEGLGARALTCLSARGGSVRTAVDELMNGLVAYDRPVAIVLDDLHAVTSEASLDSLGYAIERLPANARLLASTRSDPAIGLARLRAGGRITEIRAHDMAFTVAETRQLVARDEIALSGESVERLVERTEGWPAGVYLAALWLRDLENPNERVRAFAGSARQVADYLTDEVLTVLAPETRDFLVRTSVLGRFTPELCDTVLDRDDSGELLADLARSNMFLVALDANGGWYRYHHLFGELLQLELGREQAPELHRRAAGWCAAHGLIEDALEHAAAAGDADMVAELLVQTHRDFVWGGRIRQFLDWVGWLPSELLLDHPVLPAVAAVSAMLLAHPEVEVHQLLSIAERARQERPVLWSPYVEAVVEITRAGVVERGDVGAAVEHARRAVAATRAGADVLSVGALASLAQAMFFCGDLDESRRNAQQAVERLDAPDVPEGYVAGLGLLAIVDAEQGRPESAEAWAHQALDYARERLHSEVWTASLAHLGLALACTALGRLDEAEREALRGVRLRRSRQPSIGEAHALLVLAQVRIARSRLAPAAIDLEQACRLIAEFPAPGQLPAMAATAEQALSRARLDAGQLQLVEEPSAAELAVLRCLANGLSRREIGARLYISVNTVKTHTRELYRKLNASSRADAVAAAGALGLLDLTESPG